MKAGLFSVMDESSVLALDSLGLIDPPNIENGNYEAFVVLAVLVLLNNDGPPKRLFLGSICLFSSGLLLKILVGKLLLLPESFFSSFYWSLDYFIY